MPIRGHDLVRDGGTEWNGVRNYTARNFLKEMRPGDQALFYHSNTEKAAVGVMAITRAWQPDGPDRDAKGDAKWVSVAVKPVAPLKTPVTLATIKDDPALKDLEMLRQSRLSVTPVRAAEWARTAAARGPDAPAAGVSPPTLPLRPLHARHRGLHRHPRVVVPRQPPVGLALDEGRIILQPNAGTRVPRNDRHPRQPDERLVAIVRRPSAAASPPSAIAASAARVRAAHASSAALIAASASGSSATPANPFSSPPAGRHAAPRALRPPRHPPRPR